MSTAREYIALFEYEAGSPEYGVVFPDFPGLTTAGDTYDDAVRMAHEALASHVEVMTDEGLDIPRPRALEQIKAEWADWQEWEDNYKFYIEHIALLPNYGTQKVLISMDAGLIARIDRVTKNRSAFLASAAENMLGLAPHKSLRRPPLRHLEG